MELFGQIPLWMLLVIGVIIIAIAWKLIKFAIKVFVALLLFFGVLIGLDMVGVFEFIQNLIQGL